MHFNHIAGEKLVQFRGIHHHFIKKKLQGYLEEYHFRYNRHNNMDAIFDTLH